MNLLYPIVLLLLYAGDNLVAAGAARQMRHQELLLCLGGSLRLYACACRGDNLPVLNLLKRKLEPCHEITPSINIS